MITFENNRVSWDINKLEKWDARMLNKCMKKQQEKHLRMQISKRFSTSTTWQLLMLTILWPGFQQPKRCCQCKVTSPGSTCLWRIFLRRVSCKKGKILLFWDFLFSSTILRNDQNVKQDTWWFFITSEVFK